MKKPRKALNRPINQWLERTRSYNETHKCEYYEYHIDKNGNIYGSASECDYPWWRQCKGNKFNCCKLKYHHLATRKNNDIFPDFYER